MALRNLEGIAPLLQVHDMRAAVEFYRNVLGFELVQQSQPGHTFHWCMLKLGHAVLMLNTKYEVQPPVRESAPDHSDLCLYFGCEDADQAYAELRTKWHDIRPPKTASYGMRQLYMRDPDGFGVCLQHPTRKSTQPTQ